MLQEHKTRAALLTIQRLLVHIRTRAYEKASHEELANLLDDAEYLPALMLEAGTDHTAAFRDYLAGMGKRHPPLSQLATVFDATPPLRAAG